MKKINSSGFVMAETLIVTVFLTVIFAMLYGSFLPLAGEYEKRENYDNVDGKYAVYWIKRMIEDSSYNPGEKANSISQNGYLRFQCSDIVDDEEKRAFCINLVKELQVASCNGKGDGCEIYITKYRLDNPGDDSKTWFKEAVTSKIMNYQENCAGDDCKESYINSCLINTVGSVAEATEADVTKCTEKAEKKVFRTDFQDYIFYLPDYTADSLNYANYRVIACFHNKKDNNNYYSYATIEVSR